MPTPQGTREVRDHPSLDHDDDHDDDHEQRIASQG
jgi:hypothetical protein